MKKKISPLYPALTSGFIVPSIRIKELFVRAVFVLLLSMVCINADARTKKGTKKPVPKLTNFPSCKIDDYRLHGGDFVVRGTVIASVTGDTKAAIKQYEGKLQVYTEDYITNQDQVFNLKINEDGTIAQNIHIPYPMTVRIEPIDSKFICPGDTVDFTIDVDKSRNNIHIKTTGLSSEVNNYFKKVIRGNYLDPVLKEKFDEKDLGQLLGWRDKVVDALDNLVIKLNNGLPELEGASPLATDIVKTKLYSLYFEKICEKLLYYFSFQEESDEIWKKYFSFVSDREDYLMNNPLMLIACDYLFFSRVDMTVFSPFKKSIQYYPFKKDFDKADYENFLYNQREYASLSYLESRLNQMKELREGLCLTQDGILAQIVITNNVFEWADGTQYIHSSCTPDEYAEKVAALHAIVTDRTVHRIITNKYRDYVKTHELNTVDTKPVTKGDSIFQSIIDPYKGNVLFIEFWDMSCAPCRQNMIDTSPTVEAYKDKPIKWLYVTGDSHEKCNAWLNKNNVKGERIFMSNTDWGYLAEKFGILKTPFFVIIDKKGTIRTDYIHTNYLDLLNE